LAQSLFQVGGNAGSSLGPLLAALIVIPHGQRSIAWFSVAALVAIVVLTQIGRWYKQHPSVRKARSQAGHATLSRNKVMFAMGILILLV
ncbi:MFS transporter, partial [Pseudomonas sp. FW301-21B01]